MSGAPRKPNEIRLGAVGGTARYYAVQERGDGGPSRVRRTPQQAFGQITTIGDTQEVSDQRTASLIFGTGGGLGRDAYQETEGLTQYRWGEWDTRVEGAAVLPLAATQLGAATSLARDPVRIEYLGLPGALLLAWVPYVTGAASTTAENVAVWTGAAWVAPTIAVWTMRYLTGFARYRGNFYLTANTGTANLFHSTDGLNWASIAGFDTRGCCVHDNKFYVYSVTSQMIQRSLDPLNIASWAGSNETLDLHPNEEVVQLAEWVDESNRKCVMILTTQRLLRYDDEALTYTQLDDFSGEIWASSAAANTFLPSMTVWKADNNLYVNFYDRAGAGNNPDTILQYTRQQKGAIAPNKLRGIPAAQQLAITHTVGGLNYLFAFGAQPVGTGNMGQVLAWDGQGWHPLYTPFLGTYAVWGGGYGRGTLYTARADRTIVSQPYGDNRIRPEYRTGAAYEVGGARGLRLAVTDGGTPNLGKRELWLTIVARKQDRTFGLDPGCRIDAYRGINGAAVTLAGTATSATTFPWRVDLAGKASWYEMEIHVSGFTTIAANTPALVSVQLHYDRTPQDVKDSHDFVIDLAASAGEHGRSAAAVAAELLALRGQLVTLAYGAGAWGDRTSADVAVACGIFQAALEADPLKGPVLLRCEVRDLSTPASG